MVRAAWRSPGFSRRNRVRAALMSRSVLLSAALAKAATQGWVIGTANESQRLGQPAHGLGVEFGFVHQWRSPMAKVGLRLLRRVYCRPPLLRVVIRRTRLRRPLRQARAVEGVYTVAGSSVDTSAEGTQP